MLKRIAVLGADETAQKALEKGIKKLDVQLTPVEEGAELPDFTGAVVHGGDAIEALPAALQLMDHTESLLHLLAEAVDCRESFRPGSSERVVEHATRFAKALELSDNERLLLERAALLRDIGKLRIPNEVLLKDGLLTYDEWNLIQQHTTIGADLVASIPGLGGIMDIVRCHHESWDGDGYPDKLEGENIPLLARALKIIDVFCAMTSPRTYRLGHASKDDATLHLENEQGKHFDPDLVDVFLKQKIGKVG